MAAAEPQHQAAAASTPLLLRHVKINLHDSEEQLHRSVLALCNEAFGWGLAYDDAEFERIAGGISNILVKVAPRGQQQQQQQQQPEQQHGQQPEQQQQQQQQQQRPAARAVAVKIFGEKTELLVDRAAEERAVVALGARGFGPGALALFGNGRVEQFLHCAPLTPAQMRAPEYASRIAALLARFHASAVPAPARAPALFATIRRWLATARALEFEPGSAKAAAFAALDLVALAAEVDATEAACAAARSPTVFAHCDLLSGNVLVLQRPGFDPAAPDPDGPLTLIDFEYGGYAPRGFDWGNHFNEYAGFECDYSKYPAREQQALFFEHYFQAAARLPPDERRLVEGGGCGGGGGGAAAAPPPRLPLSPAALDALCAEAGVFALASHLYWGVWALVQARYSPIDFDYMGYHALRLAEYRRCKAERFAAAARAFGGAERRAAAAGEGEETAAAAAGRFEPALAGA